MWVQREKIESVGILDAQTPKATAINRSAWSKLSCATWIGLIVSISTVAQGRANRLASRDFDWN
jgi:hypothetical protein